MRGGKFWSMSSTQKIVVVFLDPHIRGIKIIDEYLRSIAAIHRGMVSDEKKKHFFFSIINLLIIIYLFKTLLFQFL